MQNLTARLACIKHAASVHPEPGSNSPKKEFVFASVEHVISKFDPKDRTDLFKTIQE